MLEHTQQELTPSIRPHGDQKAPQALSAQRQAQVEAYLDHLCSRVTVDHPGRNPAELRLEAELRLMQLMAAHEELGMERDAAMVCAMKQLRGEYATPVATAQVRQRANLLQKHSWLRPALLPLSLFSAFYLADTTKLAWRVWTHLHGIPIDAGGTVLLEGDGALYDAPFYRFELFVVPLLVGLITGLILRKKAGPAVLNALALLAVAAILWPGFIAGLGYAGIMHQPPSWLPVPQTLFVPGATGAPFWIAMGYGGAQLGNQIGRFGRRFARGIGEQRAGQ